MENQPPADSSRNSLLHLWPWLAILLVLLLVGFIRFRLLDMPLERDEGEYAYAGQLILQGIPPYELAYNMKLPGTYFAYAAGMAVFGQTAAGVHATLIVVNSLTIIFVFFLGRKLLGLTAGLAACATFAILSVSPAVMGMAAHANHFVILFAVPAALLLWKFGESKKNSILFLSGLLFGLAFLMKQQAIGFCLFGWGFLFWQAVSQKTFLSTDFARRGFYFGWGMLLPFVCVCVFLALAGVFARFWFWTFTYASSYVTGESLHAGVENFCGYLQKKSIIYAGYFGLALLGMLAAALDKTIRKKIFFVIAFLFFSFLGTATGLYFREHYFILLLPAFALAVGLAVLSLQNFLKSKMPGKFAVAIPWLLFAVVLVANISYQREFFFQWPAQWVCRAIYQLDPFLETPVVAQYIREHSPADARLAVIGSEPEIYFYANRHSATGYLYTYPLMEPQPFAAKMQTDMIGEIESSQPEYLVWIASPDSWDVRSNSDRTIFGWFPKYVESHYEKVGIVDAHSADQTIFFWDDDVKKYYGEPDLAVYRKKSNPGAAK